MKYCTVTSYMSKGPEMISNNHMCAERQLIRRLYRECLKKGYKSHQFTEWLHRKYGHLVITRRNTLGDAISLPCVLCRKMIERYDICWAAHDGHQWVHSKKSDQLPQSIPTAKQKRNLGFGSDDESQR
jgi:cytidine deaminase